MSAEEEYPVLTQKVHTIAKQCGRDPSTIQVIVVTKGHSFKEISPVYEAGARDFGESRLQEAFEKMSQLGEKAHWHLIGTLQANKVNKAVGYFALIHSVDSFQLAQKIALCSQKKDFTTAVLLQVNTSGEASKHGFTSAELKHVFLDLLKLPHLQIQGLMTMAPLTEDQKVVRSCFAQLRCLRDELVSMAKGETLLPHLSMGMSHDYPIAIEEGATLLRIGTAIFGKKELL